MKTKNKLNVHWGITIACVAIVFFLGIMAALFPEGVKTTFSAVFDFFGFKLGWSYEVFTLIATVIILGIAFSRYGQIHLGGSKPDFSKFKLFAMSFAAGMGGSTMYWAFIESIYYYMDPQFGIVDPAMALEYGTAYNMFHWGPMGWALYLIIGVPFLIIFYVKKSRNLSFSGLFDSLYDGKFPKWGMRLLDFLFILTTLFATALTLGLVIPMISSTLSNFLGIPDTLMSGIIIILALAVLFTLSSYIGIAKGMARISGATIYVAVAMVAIILVIGPTWLIFNNTTNAIGIMISDYIRMSLNTAPHGTTGFPQWWTIFFIANWFSYGPGVGVFITKIAKGHKLKDVILILMGAGTLGCCVFFGVCGTYTMDFMNKGVVDAVGLINAGNPAGILAGVFNASGIPAVMYILYLVSMILFTVTTLDGTSYSLAASASKRVSENGDVNIVFRLFWCLLLTVIPIVYLIMGADMSLLKTFPVAIVFPLMPLALIAIYKAFQTLQKTFGTMTAKEIDTYTIDGKIPGEN